MRQLVCAMIVACALLASVAAHGQQPILEFTLSPQPLRLASGGQAVLSIGIVNGSMYDADDIEAIGLSGTGLALANDIEPIEVISPFEAGRLDVIVAGESGLEPGVIEASIEIIYTYCIGELCFQFAEPLDFEVTIEEATSEPVDVVPLPSDLHPAFPWRMVAGGLGLVLLLGAGILRRTGRAPGMIVFLLLAVAIGALAIGVIDRQHEQAQGIGAVLCTSCVGIEEARAEEPELSSAAIAEIASITAGIDLIVFSAEWCHACPYAKKLVDLVAAQSDQISYRTSDVEVEPELAVQHGVARSGRTIVPAVLRVDTGEVVFGVEDLEARLLDMLRRGE